MTGKSAAPLVYDDPLVPISGRFSLSRAGLPVSDQPPSGPTTRPFALRFAREMSPAVSPALPAHRYCPQRQILVTDDAAARPIHAATMTTIGTKDGESGPQEDWKPDLTFQDTP